MHAQRKRSWTQIHEKIISSQSDEIKVLKSQLKAKDAKISEHKAKEERERSFDYYPYSYSNPREKLVEQDGKFYFYQKRRHCHLYMEISEDEFLKYSWREAITP